MSLCDDTLLCNFAKCRVKLTTFAWVTACSHVFCDQHGSREFNHAPTICPACSSTLSKKIDILRTELSPSEHYKAMVLCGLRPDIVLDITSRALAFWNYQVHQERMYQEYSATRVEKQLLQMENVLTQQNQTKQLELSAMKAEIAYLKKMLEDYKRKNVDVSERLMEKSRQYQKLQGMYEQLRMRTMVLDSGQSPRQLTYHNVNTGVASHQTPERNPHFLPCLDSDRRRNFFQLCSPVHNKDRAVMKN
ncbi:E3 ubiquitin-protein ligase CCNB1IP1 isoform X2 [Entelurus aequoreus]|nr:E3 ubiquitin-protein ligase CCNB1IP1 isoform X2 [Entelurus aequoreus]XP_061922853.1 E3 ubiquitin-protein ligase CCNB1IP1 isoform X2 [Entelurus aequoreus]XP_061922855.1 E3 ubiquitin-protein ligase CCNB1IP1 isoform X2 [Entelurus aequoreus]